MVCEHQAEVRTEAALSSVWLWLIQHFLFAQVRGLCDCQDHTALPSRLTKSFFKRLRCVLHGRAVAEACQKGPAGSGAGTEWRTRSDSRAFVAPFIATPISFSLQTVTPSFLPSEIG